MSSRSCLALIFLSVGCASSPIADRDTVSSRATATRGLSARGSESTVPAPTKIPSTVRAAPTHTSVLPPALSTQFSPPMISLEDSAAELLADTDPSLHPRLELSRTIPMSTLWEHEGWREHGARYGEPATLRDGGRTDVLWSDQKQVARIESGSPLAHLIVYSIDDPPFDPYPEQRWSSCPIRAAEPEISRSVQVVVLDAARAGWAQAAAHFCAGTLDDVLSELSALPTANVRAGTPEARSTAEPSATKPVTAAQTSHATATRSLRIASRNVAAGEATATSDPATVNTLHGLGLRQGAWWRYRFRSRGDGIGAVPGWWRGVVVRRVRSVSAIPGGGYLVDFEEEVTRADDTVESGYLLLAQPPLYVAGRDVETVYDQDGALRLASEVAEPYVEKLGPLAVTIGTIDFYPTIELIPPGSWESEAITVPMNVIAGTFEDCHRLKGYSMGMSISEVYCPEVGLVRQVFGVARGVHGSRDWLELEAYDVRGQ